MNVLSLDLSLSSTGFAIFKDDKIIRVSRICTEGKELTLRSKKHLSYEYFYGSPKEDLRMYYIATIINDLIDEYKITDVVIESTYIGKNAQTGMTLSKLKGFTVCKCMYKDCNIHYLLPTEIRKALFSRGSSDKEMVHRYICRNYVDLGEYSDKTGKNKTSDLSDATATGIAFLKINDINVKKLEE